MSASSPRGALVSGGARGIGKAVVSRLANRGDVVFIADKDIDEAQRVAAELADAGCQAEAVDLDVTDVTRLREVVREVDAGVPLWTVVNNAGVGWTEPLLDVTPSRFDALMAVNVRGVFFLLQAAARVMTPRRFGSIVNIASTSSFTASTHAMSVYDTSKGAVRMLTVAAARELAVHRVRVNAVAPGTVDTDFTRGISEDSDMLGRHGREQVPLGRLASPTDIAAAVNFLSSEDASHITGHVLVVDGGWLT